MKRQRRNEAPIGPLFLKHVPILQRKIGHEVFQLKHHEEYEDRIYRADR